MRTPLTGVLAAIMVASLSVLAGPVPQAAQAGAGDRSPHGVPDRIPGRWIVALAPGVQPHTGARSVAADHGGRAGHVYRDALRGFTFHGTDEQAEKLASDPRVRAVEPDVRVRIASHGTRTFQAYQRIVRAHLALHDGHAGRGARVAVLDTGVADHSSIPRIDRRTGRSCVGGGTGDPNGHGTASAGNVVAVASMATIVPITVLGRDGSGNVSSLLCGIDHVTALNRHRNPGNHVDVANMSLTVNATCSNASLLCDALTRSLRSGAAYTAAAGNSRGDTAGILPAAHPGVIGVSSLQGTDQLASFSNFGAAVDMIAPGVSILSPAPGGGFTHRTGTSRSAPMVAGVAAIVKALQPDWSAAKVRRTVLSSGRCPDAGPVRSNLRCGGSWVGDPDGITEPLANAMKAGRAAGRIPSLLIRLPRPDGVTLSGTVRVVIVARDENPDATDSTADLIARFRLGPGGTHGWRGLTFGGDGRFVRNAFDTTTVANGTYWLVADVIDAHGNRAVKTMRVSVSN